MTDDSEKAELRKKIAQAEKRLLAYQEVAAKYQAEAAEINQRIAHLEKRQAALTRFYKRGPHSKKKFRPPRFLEESARLYVRFESRTDQTRTQMQDRSRN